MRKFILTTTSLKEAMLPAHLGNENFFPRPGMGSAEGRGGPGGEWF